MKLFRLLLIAVSATTLVSCNDGAGRGDIGANTYGHLSAFNQLNIPSAYYGGSFAPANLQNYVTGNLYNGVCKSMPVSSSLSTLLCGINTAYINGASQFGMSAPSYNVSNFVTNGASALGITNIVSYKINYNTPGQPYMFAGGSPSNEQVSGLVLVPVTSTGKPYATPKGILLYYHGTVLDKTGVPSYVSDPEGVQTAYMLATIYASQGYIVVAPDYVGQGDDNAVMHPYAVYPQVNALSGIFMLSATNAFLAQQYPSIVPTNNQPLGVYISSYSEGGAYALWASRFLQNDYSAVLSNNNLSLKRTVGISGSYDLSQAQIPYVYQDTNNIYGQPGAPATPANYVNYYPSPGMNPGNAIFNPSYYASQAGTANFSLSISKANLASYAFTSFINYNYPTSAFNVFFNGDSTFLDMNNCLDLNAYPTPTSSISVGSCYYNGASLAQLFSNNLPSAPAGTAQSSIIGQQIAGSAMGASYNYSAPGLSPLTFYTGGQLFNNVIATIFSGGQLNNSVSRFANPVSSDILPVIAKADTWQFTTNSPISLVYMNYDSTVTNISSKEACSTNGVNGMSPGKVTCIAVDNTRLYSVAGGVLPLLLEHGDAEFTLNLVALNEIQHNTTGQ